MSTSGKKELVLAVSGQVAKERYEDYIQQVRRRERSDFPETLLWNGSEYPLQQLQYSLPDRTSQLELRVWLMRKPRSERKVEKIFLILDDFELKEALPEVGAPTHYCNGLPWSEGSVVKGPMSSTQKKMLAMKVAQTWQHAVYAGKHWFKKGGGEGVTYLVGDVTITMVPAVYTEDFFAIPRLSALFPIVKPEGSFMNQSMYGHSAYSLWTEYYHGPMADQIIAQWPYALQVPADGAGLFASRTDRAVCSDIQQGHWVHKSVKQQSLSESLRTTPPGALQVLMFCHSFMTKEDYRYLRPPFIIVDKYAPSIRARYVGKGYWTSESLKISMTDPFSYDNPPFSENLIHLGQVSFQSEHLISQYAERLLIRSPNGVPVTQTWDELLSRPTVYSAMVGMVPVILDWHSRERIYTRVIYTATEDVPLGSSYFWKDDIAYFFFLNPGDFYVPELTRVEEFPIGAAPSHIGDQLSTLTRRYGTLLPILLPLWQRRGFAFVRGRLKDLSSVSDMVPYLPRWTESNIPEAIWRPHVEAGRLTHKNRTFALAHGEVDRMWVVVGWAGTIASGHGKMTDYVTDYGPGRKLQTPDGEVWSLYFRINLGGVWIQTWPHQFVKDFVRQHQPTHDCFTIEDNQGYYRLIVGATTMGQFRKI